MSIVKAQAQPRASLLGNPSDLYGGAGVAFTFADCRAEVTITAVDGPQAALPPGLLAATWQVFGAHHRALPRRRAFAVAVTSDIPRQVGLAGSSAIAIAFLRALHRYHDLPEDPTVLARLALTAENDVLGIRAGPMDRLAQAHEGLLQMDFARPWEPSAVTRLPAALLPRLGIVYDPVPKKSSGAVHQPVFERWQAGDPEVRAVVAEYRPLVAAGLAALQRGDERELRRLIDANFDLRARLFAIGARDRAMIDFGRARGAATKFCGSGGAVLVLPKDPGELAPLLRAYEDQGFRTLLPHCLEPARPRLRLIVLAAGFAVRLYPLTQTCSKPLLDVGGVPLLTRIVRQFAASHAVVDITVVHNRKFAADYRRWRASMPTDLPIALVDNGAAADTEARGAIRDLQLALAAAPPTAADGYVVAGGDNVFDFDVHGLIQRFAAHGRPQAVLRHVGQPVPGRYSEAVVDDAGRVTRLREKPPDPASPWSAICLYFLPSDLPALVDRYLAQGGNTDAPGHFLAWLVRERHVHGERLEGRWFDIGNAATLAEARAAMG